jgi:hypothetical protein
MGRTSVMVNELQEHDTRSCLADLEILSLMQEVAAVIVRTRGWDVVNFESSGTVASLRRRGR